MLRFGMATEWQKWYHLVIGHLIFFRTLNHAVEHQSLAVWFSASVTFLCSSNYIRTFNIKNCFILNDFVLSLRKYSRFYYQDVLISRALRMQDFLHFQRECNARPEIVHFAKPTWFHGIHAGVICVRLCSAEVCFT